MYYSATRKLGRLFRIPLMNLLTTWTSREQWMGQNCSEMKTIPSLMSSSKTALRSVQKTGGLFNSGKYHLLKRSHISLVSRQSRFCNIQKKCACQRNESQVHTCMLINWIIYVSSMVHWFSQQLIIVKLVHEIFMGL